MSNTWSWEAEFAINGVSLLEEKIIFLLCVFSCVERVSVHATGVASPLTHSLN